jgi:4-alpha-glucanotransferase
MRVAALDRTISGISIPVAALRTGTGCGTGEFADLAALGRWCRAVGLELIQLLPVNDTGTNSSPYSALSAFALHPLYLDLQAVAGSSRFAAELEDYRKAASAGRLSYARTRDFKLSLVQRIFENGAAEISADPGFARWRRSNPWVIPYAVFTALKSQTSNAPWSSWADMADPTPGSVQEWWTSHPAQCMPAAWIQYLLEGQLSAASKALESMGVALKGDLPILMSRESVDVWFERDFFDLSGVAGAPPDMFSPHGQNWGFPVYDWENLGQRDYRWWKDRLRQAGKFFHAFRIDHVLGFFRIWRIPHGETSGLLGRFSPSSGLSRRDLESLGFDEGRIRWLSVPHVSGAELRAALGGDAPRAARYLSRVGQEELYNIAPAFDSEAVIHALDEPARLKDFLLSWHVNRALLEDGAGTFFPAWYLEDKKAFQGLSEAEKRGLRDLAGKRRAQSEEGWESGGKALLTMIKASTDMLVCAEDLGDVPQCVPRVLDELGILGLRIVRWAREYHDTSAGQPAPFTPPERYPLLSVCTPSVHDTSTVRGWWEEDLSERELFFRSMGGTGPCPPRMTLPLLQQVFAHCTRARSRLCVFQVQDLLDLDESLWAPDPKADRINVPGTVNDTNWTWRMPVPVEDLENRAALGERVKALTGSRIQ